MSSAVLPAQSAWNYTVRRNRLVPKHTLHGSTLQRYDDEDRKNLAKIDLNALRYRDEQERVDKEGRYEYKLPTHLKHSAGTREQEDRERKLFEQQQRTIKSQKNLHELEDNARYFQSSSPHNAGSRSDQRVGIHTAAPGKGRRFQYGSPEQQIGSGGPIHQHRARTTEKEYLRDRQDSAVTRTGPWYERHRGPDWKPAEAFMYEEPTDEVSVKLPESIASRYGCYRLPANIQHKFGTQICRSLLADSTSATDQSPPRPTAPARRRDPSPIPADALPPVLDPTAPGYQYKSLGLILRQNIFNGFGVTYDRGVTQTDFNESIPRQGEPLIDKYRCRKDDVSKWAEADVLWGRLKKSWDDRKLEDSESKTNKISY